MTETAPLGGDLDSDTGVPYGSAHRGPLTPSC